MLLIINCKFFKQSFVNVCKIARLHKYSLSPEILHKYTKRAFTLRSAHTLFIYYIYVIYLYNALTIYATLSANMSICLSAKHHLP